jgi:trans-2,3-dihydro-3-hydroxyanthranilate isomerase
MPMRHRFLTADVFTDRAFGGNPLAVLPDARRIEPARMQEIAREFNLSETVFVLPPDDPAHTRRLKIFTPAHEVPFAGHPTVGTALVLAAIGAIELEGETTRITFEEGAGRPRSPPCSGSPQPTCARTPACRPRPRPACRS